MHIHNSYTNTYTLHGPRPGRRPPSRPEAHVRYMYLYMYMHSYMYLHMHMYLKHSKISFEVQQLTFEGWSDTKMMFQNILEVPTFFRLNFHTNS